MGTERTITLRLDERTAERLDRVCRKLDQTPDEVIAGTLRRTCELLDYWEEDSQVNHDAQRLRVSLDSAKARAARVRRP